MKKPSQNPSLILLEAASGLKFSNIGQKKIFIHKCFYFIYFCFHYEQNSSKESRNEA